MTTTPPSPRRQGRRVAETTPPAEMPSVPVTGVVASPVVTPDPHAPNPSTPPAWAAPAGPLDPLLRWRVTYLYRDDAPPPVPGGAVADQGYHLDEGDRDEQIGLHLPDDRLGRILIEERMYDDVTLRPLAPEQWRVLRTWTRTPEGPWGSV